jgi:hypothetical protein
MKGKCINSSECGHPGCFHRFKHLMGISCTVAVKKETLKKECMEVGKCAKIGICIEIKEENET